MSSSERLEHEQRPDSTEPSAVLEEPSPEEPSPDGRSPAEPGSDESPECHRGQDEPIVEAKAVPAAVRYKEITATAVSAAERMRKIESERVAELTEKVSAGRERIDEAEQHLSDVTEGVRLRWDSAREALWNERWMRVPPMPAADTSATPARPDESLRSVQSAYLALREAIGKRRWSAGKFKPRRDRGEQ